MKRPWSTIIGSARSGPQDTAELEILQTDVMRFLAIMALCLMIVFALVRAFPAPPEPRQRDRRPRQALAASGNRKAPSTQRAARGLARPQRAEMELQEVLRRLHRKKGKLLALEVAIEKERAALSAARSQLPDARLELNSLRLGLERSRRRPARLDKAAQPPRVERPAETTAPEDREVQGAAAGLSLRFASKAVLEVLIKSGSVGFYALQGKRAWRLQIGFPVPFYRPSPVPSRFYEMAPETVPLPYKNAFQRIQARPVPKALSWAVTLPAGTEEALQRLLARYRTGVLTIRRDASVVHTPDPPVVPHRPQSPA